MYAVPVAIAVPIAPSNGVSQRFKPIETTKAKSETTIFK